MLLLALLLGGNLPPAASAGANASEPESDISLGPMPSSLPSGPAHKSVHEAVAGLPGWSSDVRSVGLMLDRLTLPPPPTLQPERASCAARGNRMLMTGCVIPSTRRKRDGLRAVGLAANQRGL